MRQGHTARGGGEPVSEPRARAGPRELQVSAQSPAVKQREATSLQPDPRGLMLFTRHFPGKGPVSGPLSRQPERGGRASEAPGSLPPGGRAASLG